jgi:hypothetical protein
MADLLLHQTVKMGLAAFATKRYFVGDVVLSEDPLMIVRTIQPRTDELVVEMDQIVSDFDIDPEIVDTVIAFLNTPEDKRGLIMKLFCPERKPKSKIFIDCEKFSLQIAESATFKSRYPWATSSMLQDFLLIWDINCHGEYMYNLATRLAHSCDPNTFCRSDTGSDTINYIAIDDINAGDLITFGYLGGGPHSLMPTHLRRKRLLGLGFHCSCARCTGPDQMRTMSCPSCGEPSCVPMPLDDISDGLVTYENGEDCACACYAAPPSIGPERDGAEGSAGADGLQTVPCPRIWKCRAEGCGKEFSDADMPLEQEAELEAAVLLTCCRASRSALPPLHSLITASSYPDFFVLSLLFASPCPPRMLRTFLGGQAQVPVSLAIFLLHLTRH